MARQEGQSTVELVAALPALLLAGLLALQLLVAGYSLTLADGAAEAGALALASGRPAVAAARDAVPDWVGEGVDVSVEGGRVTVRLRPTLADPGRRESPRRHLLSASEAQVTLPVRLSHLTGSKGAPEPCPVVLVTQAGAAAGSRATAAALACAASEPDRAALLIDLEEGRAPRSTLVATAGARALEERVAAHLPDAAIASRGCLCQLTLSPDPEALGTLAAALPLARESAAIVHLPPPLLRTLLAEPRIRPTGAVLRADLEHGRSLTALAVRDLIDLDLRTAVVKRPLGWLAARAARLGALREPPSVIRRAWTVVNHG